MCGKGGVCMVKEHMHGIGGHVWQGACMMVGGMHGGGGHAWQRACVAGGMHVGGHVWQRCEWQGHAWQDRWPLQRTVRILLECILVSLIFVAT